MKSAFNDFIRISDLGVYFSFNLWYLSRCVNSGESLTKVLYTLCLVCD